MKLVTIACVPEGRPGAVLENGEIVHLSLVADPGTAEAWLPITVRGILEAGDEGLALVTRIIKRVERMSEGERSTLREQGALLPATVRLLAPITNPCLILSIGQAYRLHVKEMKSDPPREPHSFLKSPSAITSPDAAIRLPPQCPDQVDFEGELCAVIGRTCHNVTEGEAMSCVVGYTITNDVSARDWVPLIGQAKTTSEARTAWDLNHMGKQLPGFSPLGPVLVTKDEIVDPGNLDLTTRLNGQVMQQANTNDLIFSLSRMIAYFSRWYVFSPGDIISTGTPQGVGYGRNPKVLLKPGDVVEVEVSGVGVLRNRFVGQDSEENQ